MTSTRPNRALPASLASSADPLLWTGLVLVLAPLLVRATSTLSLLPGWDMDPLILGDIRTGLTPSGSIVVDGLVLIGSMLLLLFAWARGAIASVPTLVLSLLGAIPVLAHTLALPAAGVSLGDARVGGAWISAALAGVSIWHAASVDRRAFRVVSGVLAGFLALLALRGAQEWFIEFPRQLEMFRSDKERVLASHGWVPGSPAAQGFERRVTQREASGWFGLSNVFASLAAAGVVLFIALLAEAYRRVRLTGDGASRTMLVVALAGATLSAGALSFSQSKGGLIACLAGLVALAALMLVRSSARSGRMSAGRARVFAGIVGVGAVLGALALVSLRGALGERIAELSLLFRWFYAQAAVRIFAQSPLWGVGPDGFQSAYAQHKNPLSAEDVTSPHILVLDHLATLGVLGLAWVCLLIRGAWCAGAAAAEPEPAPAAPIDAELSDRSEIRALLFIPAAATIGSTYLQGVAVTPELALVRLIGLLIWCALGWGIWRAVRQGLPPALAFGASALALAAHAQIDVAGSWSQSAGLIAVWIALGAVRTRSRPPDAPRSAPLLLAALAILPVGAALSHAGLQARVWESHLLAGADELAPVVDVRRRLELLREAAEANKPLPESMEQIAASVGAALGKPPPADQESFTFAMVDLESRLIPRAADHLALADRIDPSDPRARREASRLYSRLAENLRVLGRTNESMRAVFDAERALRVDPAIASPIQPAVPAPRSGEWYALHLVRERRAELSKDPEHLRSAADALDRALEGDPYNLDFARRRFRLAERLSDPLAARLWARRCLELHSGSRLDPVLRGLSQTDLADIQRAAGAD